MDLLLVRSFLLDHTFQQLEDLHGVCARPSADFTKLSLNYDQILAINGDRLAEQCRGLVVRPLAFARLRDSNDWKHEIVGYVGVVARPMDRFYNHGDPKAADIDWSDPGLRVYEKLDGTMVVLYYDHLKGAWHAGTRSVCEADLPLNDQIGLPPGTTFAMLFWTALDTTIRAAAEMTACWSPPRALIDDFLSVLDKGLTYVFELTGPHNRIVVRYDQPRVILLAIRCPVTGDETDVINADVPHVPRPRTWPLHDVSALASFVDAADPGKLEGAVVCDSRFRRLKVKNKAWVLSSRAKDLVTVSRRSALEAVILGTIDDVLPLLDEDTRGKLEELVTGYRRFCAATDCSFVTYRDAAQGSRKAFAEHVLASGAWTPVFFALWEGKAPDTRTWVRAQAERGKLSPSSLDSILTKLPQ